MSKNPKLCLVKAVQGTVMQTMKRAAKYEADIDALIDNISNLSSLAKDPSFIHYLMSLTQNISQPTTLTGPDKRAFVIRKYTQFFPDADIEWVGKLVDWICTVGLVHQIPYSAVVTKSIVKKGLGLC